MQETKQRRQRGLEQGERLFNVEDFVREEGEKTLENRWERTKKSGDLGAAISFLERRMPLWRRGKWEELRDRFRSGWKPEDLERVLRDIPDEEFQVGAAQALLEDFPSRKEVSLSFLIRSPRLSSLPEEYTPQVLMLPKPCLDDLVVIVNASNPLCARKAWELIKKIYFAGFERQRMRHTIARLTDPDRRNEIAEDLLRAGSVDDLSCVVQWGGSQRMRNRGGNILLQALPLLNSPLAKLELIRRRCTDEKDTVYGVKDVKTRAEGRIALLNSRKGGERHTP